MKHFHFLLLALLLLWGCGRKAGEVVPAAPDYDDELMWITQDGDPEGTGADVFYVVSTWEEDWTDDEGRTVHYADVWNPTHREHMAIEINGVAAYMAPGNRFYAPFYRHATIDIWLPQDEDLIRRQTRIPMGDVCAAFDRFLEGRDPSRPLVIAGFSQGGKAVVELLKHMSDETYSQLAAAYVLGYKVTPEDLATCAHIKAAQGESDTGATVCYNTVKDVKYVKPVIAATAIGINPVNWRTDATPAVHRDSITVTLSPEYHVLVVQGYEGAEYPAYKDFINVGDIHSCEPWLYSECLQRNIAVRARAWREAGVPLRAPAEFLGPLAGMAQSGFSYQGMDISGRYLLSCQNRGAATVYRLSGKEYTPVGQFQLASFHENNHANVVSFGVEKAERGDPLPVAYISQCSRKPYNGMKDVLFAERINPDFTGSTLLQTIFYDDVNHDFGYALQWVIDRREKMLYGYGNTINNSDPANRHRIIKFRLPTLAEGPLVVLHPEDALENYLIEEVSPFRFNPIGQGLYIHRGRLYMPTGIGTPENPSILYIWNLRTRTMESVDLSESTTGELEDISLRSRRFYLQGQDGLFLLPAPAL